MGRKNRVSSGIPDLDRLLGDLYIGDNVLWYDDTGSFSAAFCLKFIQETLRKNKPLIYVTFDRSPKNVVSFLGSEAESQNLLILDCFTNGKGDNSEVFNKFYEKDGALWPHKIIKVNAPATPANVAESIYGVHSSMHGEVHFIIDSLTGMQSLWGNEESVIDFYTKTCPRLYELDTIAYWLVEKGAHSNRLKANINKIAQVAIELSVRKGRSALKILKAEKRNSKFLNKNNEFSCDESAIVFANERDTRGRFDLGAKIKSLRLMRGMSQKELASLTGVTPSTISQVEKNLIYPSLPALFRIAESLSVEMSALFRDHNSSKPSYIFSAETRSATPLLRTAKSSATAESLVPPEAQLEAEVMLVRLQPKKTIAGHLFSHKGRELGYLVSGGLEMTVENERYEVKPGDTIFLDRDTPNNWRNPGDTVAELLWVKL